MFPESLRFRIQIWHGCLLAAVLAGFAVAAYRHEAANELRRVDLDLRLRVRALADALTSTRPQGGPPPPPGAAREFRLPSARAALFEGGYSFVVWRRDGSEWAKSSGAPAGIALPPRPKGDEPLQGERTRGQWREAFTFTPPGECLLAGRSIEPELAALRDYARWLAVIAAGVLALGLAVGWWIATRAIRPVAVITATARRIALGELGERIPVRENRSELGRLAAVLNETFARLEASFARQARFTADAAHELRTPVAILLAQAQQALARERDPATYRRTLEACVAAARRLNQLADSLLELASHEGGASAVKFQDGDLAAIVRETAEPLQRLAAEHGIALALELSPAPAYGDPLRLSQVVSNLLVNALEHTPAGGRVTLETLVESGRAVFRIADTGCGIGPEHLPHLFDRFYRVDASRSRGTGGAGLGLSICKAIADAHGAALEVSSVVGQGTVFTLRLAAPATPSPSASP